MIEKFFGGCQSEKNKINEIIEAVNGMGEGGDESNYLDFTRIRASRPAGSTNEFHCSIYKIKVSPNYKLVVVNYAMTFKTIPTVSELELFNIPSNEEKIYMNRQIGTYIDEDTSAQMLVKMHNTSRLYYTVDNSKNTIKQGGTFYINTIYMED